MAMVMVAAILLILFDGTADEDDEDNDDVEPDVKDDLIVDSLRRLEQHNIMSSTTGPQQEGR